MKNNKIFFLLVSFGLLTGFFSSCQKDSVTLRLRMANFSRDGKVHMDGLTPKWDAGEDLVCVNGEACTVSNNSVSVTPSIDYKAVYPASIYSSLGSDGVYTLSIPEIQVYKTVTASNSTYQVVEAPMGAHSNSSSGSTNLWFKNLGALLAITVDNQAERGDLTVDKITVSSNGAPLWGTATLALPDVTTETGTYNPSYQITEDWDSHQSVILAGNENGGSMNVTIATGSSKQFYVYVPAFSSEPSNKFTIQVEVSNASGDGVYRRAQSSAGNGNIPLNQIGSMTFTLSSTYQTSWIDNTRPAGALRVGEFTVKAATNSAPATKVYFSAGNLQYFYGSNPQWRIAEHQWDYAGVTYTDEGTNTTISYGNVVDGNNYLPASYNPAFSKWIDLFGWGTSGYGSGNQAMPWDYLASKTYGGSSTLNENYDWGKKNRIYYGSQYSEPGVWRTLTQREWDYLMGLSSNSRTVGGGQGLNYTHSFVSVNGVPGLLIYPDDYSGSRVTNTITNSRVSPVSIDLNDYPGCAFLPCAGCRGTTSSTSGTPMPSSLPGQNENCLGSYWLSSLSSSNPQFFKFGPGETTYTTNQGVTRCYEVNANTNRYCGFSVRLVTDVPASTSSK